MSAALVLEGKVAIVTGASRGIGEAIACRFAVAGAAVMICGRRPEGLEAAAERIRRAAPGSTVVPFVANVSDPTAPGACAETAAERLGGVDILVNNAATNPYAGPLLGIDDARAAKTIQVNQLAPIAWARAAREHGLGRDGDGVILNVASIGGLRADDVVGFYNMTKAAVLHLTRNLAAELGPAVRVNALAPGLVETHMSRAIWEGDGGRRIAELLPLKRLGRPEDVAEAAMFLAGPGASWITGHTLVIDGGALVAPMFAA